MDGRSNGRADPDRETARPHDAPVTDRDPGPGPLPPRARREQQGSRFGGPADPPPPDREQLPLPRRSRQEHLEPQLRVPNSTGGGTPFAPFTPARPGHPAPGERDLATEFRDGSRRARRDTRRRPAD